MSPIAYTCLVCLISFVLHRSFLKRKSVKPPFPPGPPSNWLTGNILKVSTREAWLAFTSYKEEFGDLLFFHGLGNQVLILNSMKAIEDLLDKRFNTYSNRPHFTVLGELMGLGQSMPLLAYGNEWREHRKLAHMALSPTSVKKFHSIPEAMAILLGKMLLDTPNAFFSHIRITSGRIVMAMAYGLVVEDIDTYYIDLAEETMKIVAKGSVPGSYLCDFLPILKYLPSWVPFQKEAKNGKHLIEKLVTLPYEHVKRNIKAGNVVPSLTARLLESAPEINAQLEYRVKWTAGSLYGAGVETTYSTVLNFIMAMALHPEVQRKAQAEIDSVLGPERLPSIADRKALPYINSVIKEVMRIHPALPLSIARQSSQDDIYEEYFIPKNTIVIPNIWAIAFQQSQKYDPQSFIPERFLDNTEPVIDPSTYVFGFGRRICPGRYLAENSVFILIASIVSSFNILPPLLGKIEMSFDGDLVSSPKPFAARIESRSKSRADMILNRAAEVTSSLNNPDVPYLFI